MITATLPHCHTAAVAEFARQDQPVLARHFQIENNEFDRVIVFRRIKDGTCGRDTRRRTDVVILAAQIFLEQIPDLCLIIDDQDMHLLGHNRSLATVDIGSP
jgi:hypothetical protein